MLRLKLWVSSVASIRSKIAIVASCSAARTSSQSPAVPDIAWVRNLRPKFAAKPIAAPASAAPTSAALLLLPQEKALSSRVELSLRLLAGLRLLPELLLPLRFGLRFWVRV